MSKNKVPSRAYEILTGVVVTFVIAVLMFIPLWIFLAANAYLDPQTFFEKAVMIALGYVVLGAAQIWALFLGVVAIITYWTD